MTGGESARFVPRLSSTWSTSVMQYSMKGNMETRIDELQVWMEREWNLRYGVIDGIYEHIYLSQCEDGRDKLYSAEEYLAKQWHPDISPVESEINYQARKVLIQLLGGF